MIDKDSSKKTDGNAAQRRKEKRTQQRSLFPGEEQQPAKARDKQREGNRANKTKDEKNQMSINVKELFRSPAAWTAIFTGVLCLFTALLAWVSYQANSLNAAQQRAIVNFNGPAVSKKLTPDGKSVKAYQIYYGWQNSGRGPAKDAEAQYNFYLGDKKPTKDTDFSHLPTRDTLPLILGPGTYFQMTPIDLNVSDLESVETGKQHLFLWGWITYNDSIPHSPRRLTEFCTDVTSVQWATPGDHSDVNANPSITTPPCETHNCYDEECHDYDQRTKDE
jgi:hypothetical protein